MSFFYVLVELYEATGWLMGILVHDAHFISFGAVFSPAGGRVSGFKTFDAPILGAELSSCMRRAM